MTWLVSSFIGFTPSKCLVSNRRQSSGEWVSPGIGARRGMRDASTLIATTGRTGCRLMIAHLDRSKLIEKRRSGPDGAEIGIFRRGRIATGAMEEGDLGRAGVTRRFDGNADILEIRHPGRHD